MYNLVASKSKFVVPILAGLYPSLFFISNNSQIFSFWQNTILLTFTSAMSVALCFLLTYILLNLYRLILKVSGFHDSAKLSKSMGIASNLITANISLIICFYLLRSTLLSFEMGGIPLLTGILVVAMIISFIVYKKGLKPFFYILLILTIISTTQLSINLVKNQQQFVDDVVPSEAKELYEKLRFKKKPNVYLVIAESYPNEAALREVYGIDNSSFYKKMRSLGFEINHNYFSNYNHTLASLPSLFSMEHHYGLISLGNLDSTGGRRILELTSYNPVVSAFQNNGYKINYLHFGADLIPSGVKADFVFPSPLAFRGLEIFLTHQKLTNPSIFRNQQEPSLDLFNGILDGFVNNGTPSFNFIYYNQPGHSPQGVKLRSKHNRILAGFRSSYETTIKTENNNYISFFESIIDSDKNSLIIVIGDHGSWGYRGGEDANGNKISYPLYILDRFGVLAGIYGGPEGLSGLMSNGTTNSHVNLFKYIFAFLCEDDKVLETLRPDNSYDMALIMAIKDNRILKRPEKITLKNSTK